jgi:hypothetical protein
VVLVIPLTIKNPLTSGMTIAVSAEFITDHLAVCSGIPAEKRPQRREDTHADALRSN